MTAPAVQSFFVSGVCCATEEAVVRKRMDALAGTAGYRFNPLTGELMVTAPVEGGAVIRELRVAGFGARTRRELQEEQPFAVRHAAGILTVIAALFTVAGIAGEHLAVPEAAWRGALLAGVLVGGWNIGRKALGALRTRTLDMNVLMAIAVAGALAIDRWSEGAAVVVLFSVALMLESLSVTRTRRAIRSLMTLSPAEAQVLRQGRETTVPAETIRAGETIVVRPGERVPLDGVVTGGISSLDQSPITGESAPVTRTGGDPVYAGSINQTGSLTLRVTAVHDDTMLARIVHLVEDAQHQRAPVQTTVDRFARVYTPAILGFAVLVATVPPLVAGAPFTDWFYRALVLLVIACPCALVISTPVTIVSALANAARRGILIKGGKHLETLAAVTAVAFDKTGTLTEGRPRVTDLLPLDGQSHEEILRIAAAIEHRSEHHLASGLLSEAARSDIDPAAEAVEGFEAIPGKGVRGTIGGTTYYLGNHLLARERGFCSAIVEDRLRRLEAEGKTVVVLGTGKNALAVIAFRDGVREPALNAVRSLARGGIRHLVLVTGDHQRAAGYLAAELGIERCHAGLLPAEKVAAVEDLKRRHGTVAMIGDGINDAPALAASSVGIAMGVSGADAALETADVVLMADDLGRLPFLFGLGRSTMAIIRQNIALALGLKIVFLILSLSGVATLWMAVLADDGAALLVILNGLRALSLKDHA